MASNMQWLNDSAGNPLAAWVPGKGWVQPQNASYNVGGKLSGTNFAVDPEGGKSLSNQYYEKWRDAQLANGGQYILGSVGGSTDPFSKHVTSVDGLDLAGLTGQQRALFDPNSTWGSSGYDIWGSGTDSSVEAPSALYKKPIEDETPWEQFTSSGKARPDDWPSWLPVPSVAAAVSGAAGGFMAGAGGAMGSGTSAIGGVEGASAMGGSATAAGGAAQPSLLESFSNMFNSGSGTGTQLTGTGGAGGGAMDFGDFDFSDFGAGNTGFGNADALNFGQSDLGQLAQSGGNLMPSAVPETTQTLTDWGMQEVSPGRWAMPGEAAGSLYNQLAPKLGEAAAKSLIAKLMSGEASAGDYASLFGKLAATGLGIYGANQQATATQKLAEQYAGYGAPYRARLAESYADPNSFLANSPDIQASVKQGTDALARSLSRNGNPTGSGSALQELQNYSTQGLYGQLGNERNRLANFGGLSNFNAAAPGLAGQAIGAQGGALNALGSGISSITNPPTTLEQALNQINGLQGLKINSGTGF